MAKRATARREPPRPAAAPGLQAVSGGAASRASLALDRVIHERVRLAIGSALAVNQSLTFKELKQLLGTSDGNLSVHARRLEEAGYVTCFKSFQGRMPRTQFRLSGDGRAALERYLVHMEGLIQSTRGRR